MPIDKYYKTIDELVLLQKIDRKLKVSDDNRLKDVLMKINYFDLFNGFETLLLKNKNDKTKGYVKKTKLNTFIDLYNFDRKLNMLIMKVLGDFEVSLKTKISHYFSALNSNTNPPHLNYLDKNYYYCPASTSYEGRMINKAYVNNTFILFNKYDIDQHGRYHKSNTGQYTYLDYIKSIIPYLGRYNVPPLWVLIKQFTFGDLLIMVGLLQRNVLDKVLDDYDLNPSDREYFLNCLNVFKELRNHCAHLELINRFRTRGNMNLKIIGSKININHKSPPNTSGDMYRIPLLDTLKILRTFVSIDEIIKHVENFYYLSCLKGKKKIATGLLERMGASSINEWKKLKSK